MFQVALAQGFGHRRHVLAEAAQAQGAIQRQHFHQPANVRQPGQQHGQEGQRHHGQEPGGDAMAAPTAATGIEALLQAPGHAPERDQWMPALGLAQQRIQRHPGHSQQRHTHQDSPHWFSNSISCNGRAVVQPSSTSMGAG
ncbi:hypothetical protein D3C76_1235730 [compost metagenome]